MKTNDASLSPQPAPRRARPILRSMILGLLAAVLLAAGLPVWMLAQLGGPVSFWSFALLIVLPLLVVLIFVAPAKSVRSGVACGLAFSIPVVAACFLMATTALTGQGGMERYHGEMRGVGGLAVILSIVAMGVAAFLRRSTGVRETP